MSNLTYISSSAERLLGDYLVDGEPVTNPFDVETLPPGFYRLVESPVSSA